MTFSPATFVVTNVCGSLRTYRATNPDPSIMELTINPVMERIEIVYNSHHHPVVIALKNVGVVSLHRKETDTFHITGKLTIQKTVEVLLKGNAFPKEEVGYIESFAKNALDSPPSSHGLPPW